jgi:hypothetical protein
LADWQQLAAFTTGDEVGGDSDLRYKIRRRRHIISLDMFQHVEALASWTVESGLHEVGRLPGLVTVHPDKRGILTVEQMDVVVLLYSR